MSVISDNLRITEMSKVEVAYMHYCVDADPKNL